MRHPWMKFFPADWQSDHLLRSCSVAARGLWIELLCIMQKADPVGHLLVNGKAPSPSLLAILCGVSDKEINRLVDELQAAGVFDMAGGVIVSRRMVRDAEKAARDKENGKLGGNPAVKPGVNPPVKGEDNGGDKAHIPYAISHNKNGASAPVKTAAPDRFEEFWSLYPKREGANPKKPAKAKFDAAVKRGVDPERMIAGARILAAEHPKPTRYIPQAKVWIGEERYNDDDAAPVSVAVDEQQWCKRLQYARDGKGWFSEWGPLPGLDGCAVPPSLLAPSDGVGWTEQRKAA